MSDRNAILEALTAKMEEIWNDDLSFEDQAAAVLELVGPNPLQFADEMGDGVLTSREKRTLYRCFPQEDGRFFVSHCGFFPTLEAAQAAAQAHADAAHWKNTKLGVSDMDIQKRLLAAKAASKKASDAVISARKKLEIELRDYEAKKIKPLIAARKAARQIRFGLIQMIIQMAYAPLKLTLMM